MKRSDFGAGAIGNFPGLSPHVGVLRPIANPPAHSPQMSPITPASQTQAASSSSSHAPPPPPSWNPGSIASVNWLGSERSPASKSKPIVVDEDALEARSPRQSLLRSLMCTKRQLRKSLQMYVLRYTNQS